LSFDEPDKIIRVITFIGKREFGSEVFNQAFRLRNVISLAAGQDKPQRFSKRVAREMNLGRKASGRAN